MTKKEMTVVRKWNALRQRKWRKGRALKRKLAERFKTPGLFDRKKKRLTAVQV